MCFDNLKGICKHLPRSLNFNILKQYLRLLESHMVLNLRVMSFVMRACKIRQSPMLLSCLLVVKEARNNETLCFSFKFLCYEMALRISFFPYVLLACSSLLTKIFGEIMTMKSNVFYAKNITFSSHSLGNESRSFLSIHFIHIVVQLAYMRLRSINMSCSFDILG